jgi:hypothetical protein
MDRVKKMISKGAIGIVAFIVILGLVLLVEYFIVTYFIRFDYIVGRFMSEAPILSEADKLETYVRSFQSAIELSLLQGIYDIKDQSQPLWYDYPNSQMPDENTIKNNIIDKTTPHANDYLTDYYDFARKNAKDITITGSQIGGGEIKKWEDSSVSIEFYDVTFTGKKGSLNIVRTFKPTGRVRTQFKKVWDSTKNLISTDAIGVKIREKISSEVTNENDCDPSNPTNVINKLNDVLKNYADEFNKNDNIKIDLNLESSEISPVLDGGVFSYCKVIATVKIKMEDRTYKYPVYNVTEVVEDYLGLIYRIKTGNEPYTVTTSTTTTTQTTTTMTVQCAGGQGVCRTGSPPANILCASYCGKLNSIPVSCDSDPACQADECCCICQAITTSSTTTTIQETCRSVGGRCLSNYYCDQIGGQCIEQYDCSTTQCCCLI